MKNIFDEFNNVDIDLDEYEEFTIDDKEVDEIKNRVSTKLNTIRKKHNYKPVAAIIAGALITTMIINFDTVSATIQEVSKNLKTYFSKYDINSNSVDYTTMVGKTITDKNISVTLNEFIFDNNLIILNYTIDLSKVKEKINKENHDLDIEINGTHSSDRGAELIDLGGGVYNYNTICSFDELVNSGQLDIKIKYKFYELVPYENAFTPKYVDGSWNFDFNISDENTHKNLEKVTLSENNTIRLGNKTLIFKEAIKSDVSIRLLYDIDYDDGVYVPSSSSGMYCGTVREGMQKVKPSLCITDENGEWLELGVTKTKDTKGEYQFFLKDSTKQKYTVEILYGVGKVEVDFNK